MRPDGPESPLPDPFEDPGGRPRLSLEDAALPYPALAELCPLGSRWPDWRLLHQNDVWLGQDGAARRLDADLTAAELGALLAWLVGHAVWLHAQAATDERSATSSALRWAYRQAGILLVGELDPVVWLESTLLVRTVRRLLASGDGRGRRAGQGGSP